MADTPQPEPAILTKFFAHNSWANLKLLDYCETLSDEQLDTNTVGGFGTIRMTLPHIIGAEFSYVHRVNGKLPPRPLVRGEFPGFDVLKEVARWTSDELLKLAVSARADTMVQESEAQWRCEYTLASLIVQAITHATEHRAQIAAIITQLGLEPPDMSMWKFMEESGEWREWQIAEDTTTGR